MRIAICDDEQEYIKSISDYVNTYFKEKCIDYKIYEFDSGEDLLFSNNSFDILFLDVEIGDKNGLEIGKKLRSENENIIIFVITAFDKYLDGAFDLKAFRFLSKPLDVQRFYAALDAAVELLDNSTISFIDCKSSQRINLPIKDIIYVEIDNRKTKIVSIEGTNYSKEKMSYWKNTLNASYFAVPHSSFVINMNFSIFHKRNEVTLKYKDNTYIIPISAPKQPEFREKYFKFQGSRC